MKTSFLADINVHGISKKDRRVVFHSVIIQLMAEYDYDMMFSTQKWHFNLPFTETIDVKR